MLVAGNSIDTMALEFAGGALVGAAVSELLQEMISILKDIKDKDKNLLELQRHLHRLEPCVEELRSVIRRQATHPARRWLDDLERELQEARDLAKQKKLKGPFLRARMSQRLVPVNVRIYKVIHDAMVANWASTLSTIDNLTQSIEDMRALHKQNCQKQGENWSWLEQRLAQQEQVWKEEYTKFQREILQVLDSQPPHLRERQLKCAASAKCCTSEYGSSSSVDGAAYQHPDHIFDTAKPKVDFGGNLVAEDLIASLLDKQRYTKWVGLWAMGGAGKTFTAKKIFNDPSIKHHFNGGQFWITVSKDGLPARSLLQTLCNQVSPGTLPNALEEARARVQTLFDRDNVILVADDVWEYEMLELLDVLSEERKGVILVTTRDYEILRGVRAKIIKIPPLSEDHSWQLFSWHAFDDHGANLPPGLESVARDVAAECQGLPLALEVIGAGMRRIHVYNRDQKHGRSLVGEWKSALERLRGANVHRNEYKNLFRRLQLSVENLMEADARLQDCFFDFAAFPEDWDVPVMDLVNMWVAEGLVKAHADSMISSEDEAKYLLAVLFAKSMVELRCHDDDKSFGKVHDVMRDLARWNLKINSQTKRKMDEHDMKCLYAPGLGIEEFPKEWSVRGTRFAVEKLSLYDNNLRELPEYFDAPNLRVLLLEWNKNLSILPPGFFRTLTSLRVLNLSSTGIEIIPDEVVDSLNSLVLLDVRTCPKLTTISRRIGGLNSLETIFLKNSDNVKRQALSLPRSLRTLSGRFGDEVCQWDTITELHLQSKTCPSKISSLASLEVLVLKIEEGGLPTELMQLNHLKVLKVWGTYGIPCLGELPMLEVLFIANFDPYSEFHFPASFGGPGAFPCLKEMRLKVSSSAWWTIHRGSMPSIQTLTILNSSEFSYTLTISSTLRELNTLTSLKIGDLDMDHIFQEPSCFPNLETLIVDNQRSGEPLPSAVAALPRLRYVEVVTVRVPECEWYESPEDDLPTTPIPPRLSELQKEGRLEINWTLQEISRF